MPRPTPTGKIRKGKLAVDVFKFPEGIVEPWYPWPDETAQEYLCFKAYLDQGLARVMKAVADATLQNITALKALAKARKWEDRVKAYDEHVIDLEFQARDVAIVNTSADWESRRSEIRESAFNNSKLLISKALSMLEFPLEVETESVQETVNEETGEVTRIISIVRMPARWSMRDAATLLQTADGLQRLAAEMDTSRGKLTIESRKVELVVKMIVGMISENMAIPEVRRKLIEVGVQSEDIDEAMKQIDGVDPAKGYMYKEAVPVMAGSGGQR